jgi:hypothetical protein
MQDLCLQIIDIEEGEEVQTKDIGNIFNKSIAEIFQYLREEMPIQVLQNTAFPWHILLKKLSQRKRILKVVREKNQTTYKGKPIKVTRFLNRKLKGKKYME